MMDDSPEISYLIPFFYPCSQSTLPDPASTAARLADELQALPISALALASNLSNFLLEAASAHPAHIDHILHTIKLLVDNPSLPLINNWDSSRPNATLDEVFHVAFREGMNSAVGGQLETSERSLYIAGSLVAGRARSLGMLDTPEIAGSLGEGLKFPNEVLYDYQGEEAEIAVIRSCLQLLGGAVPLLSRPFQRFAKDKILASLDRVQSSQNIDALLQFTKSHFQKESVVDLTSEEMVDNLKAVGWQFPSDRVIYQL